MEHGETLKSSRQNSAAVSAAMAGGTNWHKGIYDHAICRCKIMKAAGTISVQHDKKNKGQK